MILDHAVGSESRDTGKGGKHLKRWLEKTDKRSSFAPADAIFPEKEKAQKRKEIKPGAEETQASHNENRVGKKYDNAENIQEGNKGVGTFKAIGWKNGTESHKGTDYQSEKTEGNPQHSGNHGKSGAVAVEKGAYITKGSFKYALWEIGEEKMSHGQERGNHHSDPGKKAQNSGPAHIIQCQCFCHQSRVLIFPK
jgi:hypothetical protein